MPDQPDLATAGRDAIDRFFGARKARPVIEGDRRRVAVDLGVDGERLDLSLESSARTRGVLARVAVARSVPKERWPAALLACNHWNRRQPAARLVMVTGDDRAGIVVEGWLTPTPDLADEQVARFVAAVVATARAVWTDPRMRALAVPMA